MQSVPPEPQVAPQVAQLSALATTPQDRDRLICRQLLVGATLDRAVAEAEQVLDRALSNTQVLAIYGNDSMDGVNRLNDRMLEERPPVEVPELQQVMKALSRNMRGMGRRYDPNDPKVLKRYEQVKEGILSKIRLGRTFFEEFMDDIRSLSDQIEKVVETLEGKHDQLLRNVAYYDEYYVLNEQEISKLIYAIAVLEILRDMVAKKAAGVEVGNADMGDRGGEEQARLAEIVTFLDNKIIAFKARLWVAWANAPQIRNMRAISLGMSARINMTVDVTVPTMKNTIAIWLTLREAQQAAEFNESVERAFNDSFVMFANAAGATVPLVAANLATPALDPATVVAWTESLAAQADGIIEALEVGRQKRAELERAMILSKGIIDITTQKVNQAQLEEVIAAAQEAPLQIARSVPNQG